MAKRLNTLLSAVVSTVLLGGSGAASAAIAFLGEGSIPGNATDGSGLTGLLEDGVTPKNQVGGFGSAITYSGRGNLYYAVPDRGPADGATTYVDRIYTLRIAVSKNAKGQYKVSPSVTRTRLMSMGHGANLKYLTGSATDFDATNSAAGLRFDPEGIRVGTCGKSVFVSDEYGPFIYQFNVNTGAFIRSVKLPNKYLIDYPSTSPDDELSINLAGRQSNRGMEGLAISPDGSKLYGIMQSPLIQDGGLDAELKRVGTNTRIVEIDIKTGATREFVYPLSNKSNGISEILAINDHEFLVLERDGKVGAEAADKKLIKIDISNATDVRAIQKLSVTGDVLPDGTTSITPVTKSVFLDLLDPAYGIVGANAPEKIEGLAFGPDLADGRHLLIVTVDNDFKAEQASRIFAFAFDAADLPGFEAQHIPAASCSK
jgi:hypothetical protein